ncbi:protein kinase domain-containing protein [Verrucomicrobium spinosum]|uniref:protein kinase domain-containing protein n=1 Tax=Verrucomicrobium spinosum TaxID=2736 RepID=UPI0009464E12|nr:protein kinase [Verrucomicrobium spinosum]
MTAVTSRYELLEQLGQGGSGVVYKAMDLQLHRPVAIKRLMRSPGAGETHEDAGQLRQEALSLSALQHPNIVTIHDIGTDEDGPYVVMEYLEGQTMEQVVRVRRFPWRSSPPWCRTPWVDWAPPMRVACCTGI